MGDWSSKWQLKFNVAKCGVLHYGKGVDRVTYTMTEGNHSRNLKEIDDEKDLGVLFDKSLTFSKHIGAIANKATRILGVIKRTFDYMDEETFKALYKTMVRPHLECANSVWCPYLKRDINKLEKVQRRATKTVSIFKGIAI